MTIRTYNSIAPRIDTSAFVDDTALVIGDVHVGADSSIWPFSVVRGDVNQIRIGARTNIQDHCVLHVTHDSHYHPGGHALSVGDDVTVGHRVVLHGCTIEDCCLIGMGAIVMDGAVLGSGLLLGAGALVPPGKVLEGGYVWLGSPVRRARALTGEETERLRYSAGHYVALKNAHLGRRE